MTNKTTALLKDAILAAAEKAGKGDIVAYLERQAEENPVAFLGLLGRVLPLQIRGDRDNRPVIRRVEYVIIDPRSPSLIDQGWQAAAERQYAHPHSKV